MYGSGTDVAELVQPGMRFRVLAAVAVLLYCSLTFMGSSRYVIVVSVTDSKISQGEPTKVATAAQLQMYLAAVHGMPTLIRGKSLHIMQQAAG